MLTPVDLIWLLRASTASAMGSAEKTVTLQSICVSGSADHARVAFDLVPAQPTCTVILLEQCILKTSSFRL